MKEKDRFCDLGDSYFDEVAALRTDLEVERYRNTMLLAELDELRQSLRDVLQQADRMFRQPLGGQAIAGVECVLRSVQKQAAKIRR